MLSEETGSGGVVMRDPETDIEKFAALHGWSVEQATSFIDRVVADEAARVDKERRPA
jgi:hypothetical protein